MKVYVIDDHSAFAQDLVDCIRDCNIECEYALCGTGGIAHLAEHRDYDIVLVDYWHGNISPNGFVWKKRIEESVPEYVGKIQVYSAWTGIPGVLDKRKTLSWVLSKEEELCKALKT